ncbi:MAG: hypothetical protein FWE31_05785 [Firmicutes bacterium]|nr:hypothetical protein [Bacillota bacterium]
MSKREYIAPYEEGSISGKNKQLTVGVIDDYAEGLVETMQSELHGCLVSAWRADHFEMRLEKFRKPADVFLFGDVEAADLNELYQYLVSQYPEYSDRVIQIPQSRSINRQAVLYDWLAEKAQELGCVEILHGQYKGEPFRPEIRSKLAIVGGNISKLGKLIDETFIEMKSIYESEPSNFSELLLRANLKEPLDRISVMQHSLGPVNMGIQTSLERDERNKDS